VSASFAFPAAEDPVRTLLASAEIRRRAIGYGTALALHAALLAALILLPPAVMREADRIGQALEVRFYTVAGGPDAQTDAPLFEPPLAGGQAGSGPTGVDGDAGGEDGGAAPDTPAEAAEPQPVIAPEPVEAAVPEVEPIPEPVSPPEPGAADASLIQTPAPTASSPLARQPAQPPAIPTEPLRPDQAVATAQPGPAVPQEARPAAPMSFADILARAETQLDPEEFRILADFAGGVTGTVRENFCLSSSDANQEAFDCPEGSQLAAPRLAQFGLMGLGEEPPEFLEDMDRLAYQLSQSGAGDSTIGRILTSLREARREAVSTPALTRSMSRDAAAATDSLGVTGPITPENGRDPSGEP